MPYPTPCHLPLSLLAASLALACTVGSSAGAAPGDTPVAPVPQYIFLNLAPGVGYNQNNPDSITDRLFTEPIEKVGTRGTKERLLGLSFIFSYLDGPPAAMERTLRRVLEMAEKHDVPVLIVLDGQNWWGYRSDLWNWWDPNRPGYDPRNVANVEWSGWGSENALKIAWRNWGRQIRVLPPPNLASPRFREASRAELSRLARVVREWKDRLPEAKRHLFPGLKIGWEASLGVNAYYYPRGNRFLEQYPNDASHDPKDGLDMSRDFAGGLAPLGYAALTTKGWKCCEAITRADQERIVSDYLAFLARVCRRAGLRRQEVFTHAGGQYAPWDLHYSYRIAINKDSLPGWSFYGVPPDQAGDLGKSLERAGLKEWAAAEWLPNASTAEEWAEAYRRTLGYKACRFVAVYNWEGIRGRPEAIEGLGKALGRLKDGRG